MAEVAATGLAGFGVVLKIKDGGSTVRIGDIVGVTPPGYTAEILDRTHQESPGKIREKIGGVIDAGQVTATIRYVPGSPGTARLYADAGKTLDWVIEFPPDVGHNCTFKAVLESFVPGEAGISTLLEGTLTLAVSGPITWEEQ